MENGFYAQLACLWEATARKVGNVHCRRDFPGLTFSDFLLSAVAVGPAFRAASGRSVGDTILRAIQATREVVRTNTNLGMVLLLAPLVAVPAKETLMGGIDAVLDGLTVEDARNVFVAISLACPGGLGLAPQEDVRDEPTMPLRPIMALAADRDLVARQYSHGFREVLAKGVPWLQGYLHNGFGLEETIILTHLNFMAEHPDSLIARKLGVIEAEESSRRARATLAAMPDEFPPALADLDAWLCAQGNQRNPGTSADMVAACLFAALREGIIKLPAERPWSTGWHHG